MGPLGPINIGTSGYWGKWAFRANGHWAPEKMSIIRANQQLRQMGTLEQMGSLGPMDIGASEH